MARPQKYEVRTVEDLTHRRWCAMHNRVRSQDRHKHATICAEWFDYNNFKVDMGYCPEGYSLEREDNDLGYNKANCTWIPIREQSKNRRCNHMVAGMHLKAACELVDVPYKTAYYHVSRGQEPLNAILRAASLTKHAYIKEALK